MTALKNPYLSSDSQNLLLRKNFNVIKSPEKQSLYPNYISNFPKKSYEQGKIHNQESSTSIANKSSSVSLKNPFSAKTLGQTNQNFAYHHANMPSFLTQPYLPFRQKKQLPVASYNRPLTNRGISFYTNKDLHILLQNRRNLAVSKIGIGETSSLEKNMNHLYRPHFISPKHSNQWNTERWKAGREKKERSNLKQFGVQALRYERTFNQNLNNEYYSTSSLETETYKYHANNVEKYLNPPNLSNMLSIDGNSQQFLSNENQRPNNNLTNTQRSSSSNSFNAPQNPDTCPHASKHALKIKVFSDIREETAHQVNLNDSSSMMEDYQSFVKNEDDEGNKFILRYEERNAKKGPLDLNAFDSIEDQSEFINQGKENPLEMNSYGRDSFGRKKKVNYKEKQSSKLLSNQITSKNMFSSKTHKKGSALKSSIENIPQKDYPQRLEYKNNFYYRIKLNEDKK